MSLVTLAAPISGQAAAAAPAPVLVAFGDSITEGYGVEASGSYPAQLERALTGKGIKWRVINAGASGDTTGNALDRVESVIAAKPRLVLVEFGGNDGLRGLPHEVTRKNLDELITRLTKAGARVALIGMTLPRNYGNLYVMKFEQIFSALAAKHRITLISVKGAEVAAGGPGLMQPDGIHPTRAGYTRLVQFLLPFVEKEIRAAQAGSGPR